jgi:hypothetical protein
MAETKGGKARPAAAASAPEPATQFGGDPLAPNDAMLERIAEVINSGDDDEMVTRWAEALQALFEGENEPNTPKRILLAKVADAVVTGEADDEVTSWASGDESKQVKRSVHNLDHMG